MAHRLAARAAGKGVLRSVEVADADRLAVENQTIEDVTGLFTDQLEAVGAAADAIHTAGLDAPNKHHVKTITDALDVVLNYSLRMYRNGVEETAAIALAAVTHQHDLVEQTLARRYVGTAAAAVADVEQLLPELYDDAMANYRRVTDAVADDFGGYLDAAIRYAIVSEDTPEQFRRRILSPGPARLPGTSGRGIWWRPLTPMSRSIREGATALAAGMSSLVTAAMNREIQKR